jgi:hypothetical protein
MMASGMKRMPRAGWILAAVLILAGGFLWKIRSDRSSIDYSLGGPLVSLAPEDIDGLLLTHGGAQYRLDRTEDQHWALSGAMTDYVDGPAIEQVLVELTTAAGGPLLPGTEPEDRRYEFNALDAVRLTVFSRSGDTYRLSLGATNPVTGMVYASGAGRRACFPVLPGTKQLLRGLPESIRTKTVLPPFRFQSVSGVEIRGGRIDKSLLRRGEQWWFRADDQTTVRLGALAESYQSQYADRRWERDGETWILADANAVQLLLYEVSSLLVRSHVPASQAEANLGSWKLDPPYRRVILSGEDLNPLSAAGRHDPLEVAFGFSLDGNFVPARRLDNYLMVDEVALRTLEMPTSDLIETRALAFSVLLADSLQVDFQDETILRGTRDRELYASLLARKDDDSDRVDARSSWVVNSQYQQPIKQSQKTLNVRLQSLVVELERVPILTVLPPSDSADVFLPEGRCRVTVYRAAADETGREVVELGWLHPDKWPAGSPSLTRPAQGEGLAGLWNPRTGQLLEIPAQLLVTIRNLATP